MLCIVFGLETDRQIIGEWQIICEWRVICERTHIIIFDGPFKYSNKLKICDIWWKEGNNIIKLANRGDVGNICFDT